MDETAIKKHFQHSDPVIYTILSDEDFKNWHRPKISSEKYFHSLVNSIISQQLNTKVADIISERLQSLLGQATITPSAIVAATEDSLRTVGLSKAKISYIKNLAELTESNQIQFSTFDTADEETIIAELIKVKGIGRWTAEMFLLFALGREDVFSYGDYGLKTALKNLYGFSELPTETEAVHITDKWRPYRSVGSLVLWKSLEKKG